jgi:hypothetical protein
MEEVFDKNDSGYLRWVVTNQTGFIVNTDHDHRSDDYPMVSPRNPSGTDKREKKELYDRTLFQGLLKRHHRSRTMGEARQK